MQVFDYFLSNGCVTTFRNGFQKTGGSYDIVRINMFERFQIICLFWTIVSQMEAFTTSKNGFQKTWSSYNFVAYQHFRKFQILYMFFNYCQNGFQKTGTSSPINIFEKFQILCMLSTLTSPTRLFTASRNGLQKTGTSYSFVANQHFRKVANPAVVFNYGQASYVTLPVTLQLQRLCCLRAITFWTIVWLELCVICQMSRQNVETSLVQQDMV